MLKQIYTNSNIKQKLRFANVGEAAFATRSEGVDRPTLQSEASVSCKGSKNNEAYV
jgi:hypothetical protein